jgi:RNA polymerase I specific initiation factor
VNLTDGCATSLPSTPRSRRSTVSPVLTPDEIYQYAVAGQPQHQEHHGYPWPHGDPMNGDGPSRFDYELRQELKSASVPTAKGNSLLGGQSLHQQHLAVMTTILHRSLLEEDFVRAGRALGMILRDEMGGKPVDVRAEGRWGVGAEILMRQDSQLQQRIWERSNLSSSEQEAPPRRPRAWFTRKGFEDAKKYYERLIVQYPFYKQSPDSVSALDFYPAMFGLWIYVVDQETKLRRTESQDTDFGLLGDGERQGDSSSQVKIDQYEHQIGREEILQAKEIAERMDSVMSILPYRENVDLIRLRGMVELWIRDIENALDPEGEDTMNGREGSRMDFLTSGVTNVSLQTLA